jgi:hypothetical protein
MQPCVQVRGALDAGLSAKGGARNNELDELGCRCSRVTPKSKVGLPCPRAGRGGVLGMTCDRRLPCHHLGRVQSHREGQGSPDAAHSARLQAGLWNMSLVRSMLVFSSVGRKKRLPAISPHRCIRAGHASPGWQGRDLDEMVALTTFFLLCWLGNPQQHSTDPATLDSLELPE